MLKSAPWLLAVVLAASCASTAAPPPAPPPAPPAPPAPDPAAVAAARRPTGTGDTTTGTRAPAKLTASAARRLLVTNVTVDPNRPRLPARLNKDGARYLGMYRICVGNGGQVNAVTVDKSTGDAELDAEWMKILRTWQYRPLEMSGRKVPFCYVSTVEASAG